MIKNLFTGLQNLLTSNNKSWLYQVLAGAGLGLASTVAFTSFVDYYKMQLLQNLGALEIAASLLGLSGLDKAISILIGANLAAVYIKTFASGLKVVSKGLPK